MPIGRALGPAPAGVGGCTQYRNYHYRSAPPAGKAIGPGGRDRWAGYQYPGARAVGRGRASGQRTGPAGGGVGMGLLSEFKEFALKGSVVDLAVGVIIGAGFGKIVNSLVGDVLMPPIGSVIGGVGLCEMSVRLPWAAREGTSG